MHGVEATQRRKRQDGPIATLLLLNGPPGVGKSTLAAVARSTGARFVEVVVTDDPATIVERFARRRAELAAAGTRHPEGEISDIAAAVADACSRLDALTAARPGTVTLSLAHGPDAVLEQLTALIRSG